MVYSYIRNIDASYFSTYCHCGTSVTDVFPDEKDTVKITYELEHELSDTDERGLEKENDNDLNEDETREEKNILESKENEEINIEIVRDDKVEEFVEEKETPLDNDTGILRKDTEEIKKEDQSKEVNCHSSFERESLETLENKEDFHEMKKALMEVCEQLQIAETEVYVHGLVSLSTRAKNKDVTITQSLIEKKNKEENPYTLENERRNGEVLEVYEQLQIAETEVHAYGSVSLLTRAKNKDVSITQSLIKKNNKEKNPYILENERRNGEVYDVQCENLRLLESELLKTKATLNLYSFKMEETELLLTQTKHDSAVTIENMNKELYNAKNMELYLRDEIISLKEQCNLITEKLNKAMQQKQNDIVRLMAKDNQIQAQKIEIDFGKNKISEFVESIASSENKIRNLNVMLESQESVLSAAVEKERKIQCELDATRKLLESELKHFESELNDKNSRIIAIERENSFLNTAHDIAKYKYRYYW